MYMVAYSPNSALLKSSNQSNIFVMHVLGQIEIHYSNIMSQSDFFVFFMFLLLVGYFWNICSQIFNDCSPEIFQ